MNRQVEYITYAHLLLIIAAGGYFFLKRISPPNDSSSTISQMSTELVKSAPLSPEVSAGKALFKSKCQSCHTVFRQVTGPALGGFESRGPWQDREKLYEWIKNPALFMEKDAYTSDLKAKYGIVMTPFPLISEEQVDQIVAYVNFSYQTGQ